MKTFVAITVAGYVLFAVEAADRSKAIALVAACKRNSEKVTSVRRLRPTDMGMFGAPITYR